MKRGREMKNQEVQNTHVALECRTCRSPRTQVYTDNQHLAHSRPERGTAGTPRGWSLDRQMGGGLKAEGKQDCELDRSTGTESADTCSLSSFTHKNNQAD